jgi:two-component system, OmpR family, sensor histidine kinase CpxA
MRWPLSRKILLIALANLALVGLVVAGFLLSQFRFGPESLLLGPAQDRILAIGTAFSLALDRPDTDIDVLFASYRERYAADFFLTDPEGRTLLGPNAVVPENVLQRMHPPPRGGRKKGPPRKGPPPPRKKGPDDGPPPPAADPPRPPPPPGAEPPPVFFAITHDPTAYWAGARIPLNLPDKEPGRPAILLIRSNTIFNDKVFFDVRIALGLAAALIVVSMLCWLPFIRGLTRSIAEMDRATQQIAAGRFDAKVADARNDELGHLGRQINGLASRLESFVGSQKRFLGDIAHELCAPIARVQFALGILEQRAGSEQREHVAVLNEEIQEMSGLVNELLSFSKAGLNSATVPMTEIEIATAVERAAAREGAKISTAIPAGMVVRANELFLVRALANLLRNAVRYAGKDGPIVVTAEREADAVEIRVADSGPGLPDSELERIFTPFYRPEVSRTRETGGTGLGLAIVRTCVEACSGTVSCRNRQPHGLEVVMRFPG